jgi:hypothetical protein
MRFEDPHLDDHMDQVRYRVVMEVKDQFVAVCRNFLIFAVLIVTGVTVFLCVRLGCYSQQHNREILCEREEISLPDISLSVSEQ